MPESAPLPVDGPVSVTRTALTTKAPYQPEGSARFYQPPPPGFQPVFTENVSRHGERTLTSGAVYDLWAVTKDMRDEGHWTMDRYLTPQQASWFGYLDDVVSFYENGPAFLGDNITYKMAGAPLDDMFARAQARASGTSQLVAVLRFTHAEEICARSREAPTTTA
jgi:hypothetical protein